MAAFSRSERLRAERQAQAERLETSGYIAAATGGFACILSPFLSPQAFQELQRLPDNLEPVEYLSMLWQAAQSNLSELSAVKVPIFLIGIGQVFYAVYAFVEAKKMKETKMRNH